MVHKLAEIETWEFVVEIAENHQYSASCNSDKKNYQYIAEIMHVKIH